MKRRKKKAAKKSGCQFLQGASYSPLPPSHAILLLTRKALVSFFFLIVLDDGQTFFKMMMKEGIDVLKKDAVGQTLLQIAARAESTEVEEKLSRGVPIERKLDYLNAKDNKGCPLHVAACEGHITIVGFFVKERGYVSQAYKRNPSPLCLAARQGHLKVGKILVANITDMAAANNDLDNALFLAKKRKHTAVVDYLGFSANPDTEECLH